MINSSEIRELLKDKTKYRIGLSCMAETYHDHLGEANALCYVDEHFLAINLCEKMNSQITVEKMLSYIPLNDVPMYISSSDEDHKVSFVHIYDSIQTIIIG